MRFDLELGDIVNGKWRIIKKGQTRAVCTYKKIERSFYYNKVCPYYIDTVNRGKREIFNRNKGGRYLFSGRRHAKRKGER